MTLATLHIIVSACFYTVGHWETYEHPSMQACRIALPIKRAEKEAEGCRITYISCRPHWSLRDPDGLR